jgi:hypothetical protein
MSYARGYVDVVGTFTPKTMARVIEMPLRANVAEIPSGIRARILSFPKETARHPCKLLIILQDKKNQRVTANPAIRCESPSIV